MPLLGKNGIERVLLYAINYALLSIQVTQSKKPKKEKLKILFYLKFKKIYPVRIYKFTHSLRTCKMHGSVFYKK
jgi:hypothetical protein